MATQLLDLRSHVQHLPASRVFVALWGGLLVVDLARTTGLGVAGQVTALVVLAAAAAIGTDTGTALAVAGTAWLVVTGFVINQFGVLDWSGPGDLGRLGVLTFASLTGAGVGR